MKKKLVRPAKKTTKKTAKKVATRSRPPAGKADANGSESASQRINARIVELGDWRRDVLHHVRGLIRRADPGIVEEWKWNIPVWSHDGILCTGETYKNAVKLTFAKGALLKDSARLFNSSLEGNTRRAIDIHEGEEIDETAFQKLIRAAVSLNRSGKKK